MQVIATKSIVAIQFNRCIINTSIKLKDQNTNLNRTWVLLVSEQTQPVNFNIEEINCNV